ncbi:tetratricopeptide repeat protein [Flavivirga abyssicola]|uniref:tetratricopeptide repeat-containing sensor histidine kinase n=1 Tax=Flavivirga abyssicola TaxID=3063533 RepID=UPI0026DF874E|nr:tetratricopeptide repeat protein [Flavivirga sp. MEBiC07777]WVK15078.1 tetratricopeptide repeat protein [Flavivirga sp. MEBiC07777]
MKRKNIFILGIFFLIICNVNAQQKVIDSLVHLIKNYGTPDSTYIDIRTLYQMKKYYMTPSDSSWLDYSIKTVEVAKTMDYPSGLIAAHGNLGVVYQYTLYDPYKAIDSYQNVLKVLEENPELPKHAIYSGGVLNNIALIYLRQGEYELAKPYFKKSLKFAKNDPNTLTNLGNIYGYQKQADSALYYYNKGVNEAKKRKDYPNLANLYSNVARILIEKENKGEEAISYIEKSFALIDEHEINIIRRTVLINAAMVYLENSDFKKAKEYALEAKNLKSINTLNDLFTDSGLWNALYQIYFQTKEYNKALDAYKTHKKLLDSLQSNERKLEISKKQIQFEADKKELIAQAEIKQQTLIRNISIGTGILGISALAIILTQYRRRKEANLNEKLAKSELRKLRAQLNPHFIYNSLNSMSDFVLKNDKNVSSNYIARFSSMMRGILDNSSEDEVYLENEIEFLKGYIKLEQERLENKFDYKIEVDRDIDIENTLVPPALYQPFIENSIWHGLSDKKENGVLTIIFSKDQNSLVCTIDDNGVGIKKDDTLDKKSFGISSSKSRVDFLKQIKKSEAQIEIIEKDEGVRVKIQIPLSLEF